MLKIHINYYDKNYFISITAYIIFCLLSENHRDRSLILLKIDHLSPRFFKRTASLFYRRIGHTQTQSPRLPQQLFFRNLFGFVNRQRQFSHRVECASKNC